MKVVILAGGIGSRLGDDTIDRPKPMIEIGGRPILWHIMKHLSHYGLNEFVIALGYRGDMIKRFFVEYAQVSRDMIVDTRDGSVLRPNRPDTPWKVHLIDTGLTTNTAGRLKRLESVLCNDGPQHDRFLLTYGDGLSDVDVADLLRNHRAIPPHIATVTAVHPPARYGALRLAGARVQTFEEKRSDEAWVNGGYMVFEPGIFDHPSMREATSDTDLSSGVLAPLAEKGQLAAYRHEGFWAGMDTPRDKRMLEDLWATGKAPWKVWED